MDKMENNHCRFRLWLVMINDRRKNTIYQPFKVFLAPYWLFVIKQKSKIFRDCSGLREKKHKAFDNKPRPESRKLNLFRRQSFIKLLKFYCVILFCLAVEISMETHHASNSNEKINPKKLVKEFSFSFKLVRHRLKTSQSL